MRSIVVGLDGSDGAADALAWAAHEATVHSASLTAVLAWSLLGQPPSTFDPGYGEAAAAAALDEWVARSPVPVTTSVVCDLPASALVDASADADLLVVGSRGRGGFKALLLGSVSAVVAERALCPVAVVRRTPNHPLGPVVVGVDGRPSRNAIEWAVAEARARGVELELVRAWSSEPAPAFGVPMVLPMPGAEEAAEQLLTGALDGIDVDGLVVHRRVTKGTASGVLVDASMDAGVVVVGSRGRGGLTSVLLGSTSRHLLHHAECPVVVVR